MELVRVGEKTYYIKNPTNIGIYKADDENVYLIDSGNDKDAGKKILKLVGEQGWKVKGIINTHSNADHIGGNKVICDRAGCVVYAYNIEKAFTEYPILEPSFLYGGYPFKALRNKFLMAKETGVINIKDNLPKELEYFDLKGHFFDMIGIRTPDNVVFLGDALFSEETITKYHLFFIYDVREFLNTLDYLQGMDGKLFIPSHCEATEDIKGLIERNRNKINEILNLIYECCKNKVTFEDVLKYVFDAYSLEMNVNQYVLLGSTVRSYLSYLCDEGRIFYEFEDNKMLWKQVC